jgi:hypothetical protein
MRSTAVGLCIALAMASGPVAAQPGGQVQGADVPMGSPYWWGDAYGFYATSLIPEGDFTFRSGFVAIQPYDEGHVYCTMYGVEDPTGDDADTEGNELVLTLRVNGEAEPVEHSFTFELDDGFGYVTDDLDLDDEDEVEVVGVHVEYGGSTFGGSTFAVPGLRIED